MQRELNTQPWLGWSFLATAVGQDASYPGTVLCAIYVAPESLLPRTRQ